MFLILLCCFVSSTFLPCSPDDTFRQGSFGKRTASNAILCSPLTYFLRIVLFISPLELKVHSIFHFSHSRTLSRVGTFPFWTFHWLSASFSRFSSRVNLVLQFLFFNNYSMTSGYYFFPQSQASPMGAEGYLHDPPPPRSFLLLE